ncbi:hypothetical protein JTE90_018982 [Oedothorax gibbosus]|uniref:Uncharacterized protein n=1 Tax=Oedothorax gibbosus TaxID=931172 RepID=A0AAV6TGQ0_9ARAC|nr:hypothetical protein JTE90_018982 [Oedothorax gibbosus]
MIGRVRHRRSKKQRRYERLAATSQVSLCNSLTLLHKTRKVKRIVGHASPGLEAVHLGDLGGYGYGPAQKITLPLDFRANRGAPDTARDAVFLREQRPYSGRADSRDTNSYKKKKLFPGSSVESPSSVALPHLVPKDLSPCPASKGFPFSICTTTKICTLASSCLGIVTIFAGGGPTCALKPATSTSGTRRVSGAPRPRGTGIPNAADPPPACTSFRRRAYSDPLNRAHVRLRPWSVFQDGSGGVYHPIGCTSKAYPTPRDRLRIEPSSYGGPHPLWQQPGQGDLLQSPVSGPLTPKRHISPTPLRAGIRRWASPGSLAVTKGIPCWFSFLRLFIS